MRFQLFVSLLLVCNLSLAAVDVQSFATAQEAQRYHRLIEELRCLVCQNQNLADSNSELAQDLRYKVSTMIREGRSDEQILAYLVDHYGDFVHYRPPVNISTLLLWLGPLLFLLLGGGMLWRVVYRQLPANSGGEA